MASIRLPTRYKGSLRSRKINEMQIEIKRINHNKRFKLNRKLMQNQSSSASHIIVIKSINQRKNKSNKTKRKKKSCFIRP